MKGCGGRRVDSNRVEKEKAVSVEGGEAQGKKKRGEKEKKRGNRSVEIRTKKKPRELISDPSLSWISLASD